MTDTDKPVTGPMRRPLRYLLIGSLALNLLVFGVLVGALVSGRGGGGPFRGIDLALGPVVAALDEADRRAIRADLHERDAIPRPSRHDRETAFANLVAALRQDPFEPAPLSSLLDGLRARAEAAQAAGQEALIARIVTMTPQDRSGFADRLEAELGGLPGARGSDPEEDRGPASGD